MPGTNESGQLSPQQPVKQYSYLVSYFTANTLTAFSTTLLLNKFDEMHYLSIKNNRSFLHPANLSVPYFQGFSATLGQRMMTSGIYFVAQHKLMQTLHPVVTQTVGGIAFLKPLSETAGALSVGLAAGFLNALLTNPVAAVKYGIWNGEDRGEKLTIGKSAVLLWKSGGFGAFYTAIYPTIRREISYGSTNEILRFFLKSQLPENEFARNLAASAVASGVSSRWNYVRNKHFGTKDPAQIKSPATLFKELHQDARANSSNLLQHANFVAGRYRIGWGTLFNAVRMAIGQCIFDNKQGILSKTDSAYQDTRKRLKW